jgi:N-acetylmuramoyl-L-alanine amidase
MLVALLPLLMLLGACATAAPRPAPADVRAEAVAAPLPLPPVAPVRGAPLAVRVQYPAENAIVASRDSNFLLGSIGSGDATLTINGQPVPVVPNGAFIAWLPNPPAGAPRYELLAVRGADTVRRTLRVRYPTRRPLLAGGTLVVDSGSLAPGSRVRARADEFLRVSLRAPANATVWLQTADGARRAMPALQRTPVVTSGGAGDDVGIVFATDAPAGMLTAATRVVAARDADTVNLALLAADIVDPSRRTLVALRTSSTVGSDTDRVVNARTIPDGTYKWLLFPGTILEATGRQGGFTRVRLDETLDVWVDSNDVALIAESSARPRRVTGGFRVSPARDWVDLVIGTGERPAFLVEPDGRTLVITLYGTQANPEISPILGNDTLIRRISWDQVTSDRVRITLTLSRPVFGWLSLWDDARRAFVLRLRRAPTIDAAQPLRGLTIAVDPGHPPAGATGPTGLYEGDAVLPVGVLLADLLRQRGANVVLTRTTRDPLGLTERNVISRRANAHAFVSIHLNALPDGVNPFVNNGTSTLFFHQHSEPLARPVQRELMQRLGLRDLGVHYQNLAVARPSWYPAVLAEGAFLMMPEQEAAMRTPLYQRRYADGLLAGLETFFRELGRQ